MYWFIRPRARGVSVSRSREGKAIGPDRLEQRFRPDPPAEPAPLDLACPVPAIFRLICARRSTGLTTAFGWSP
jgi:hypothetical protein